MQSRGGRGQGRSCRAGAHGRGQVWYGSLLIGIGSLIWFLIRSGPRPSRAAYPCQKAALANATALLGGIGLPALLPRSERSSLPGAHSNGSTPVRFAAVLLAAAVLIGLVGQAAGLLPQLSATSGGQSVVLRLSETLLPAGGFSDIYAVQGTTGADGGFQRLIEGMERRGRSFYALFDRNDVLILKVNSQWDERGGTNTDLVRAMIAGIIGRPDGFDGEIVIADNGQAQYGAAGGGGSLDWKSNNAEDPAQSMQKVADQFSGDHRVSTVLWDRLTAIRVGEYVEGDSRDGYVVAGSASADTGIVVSYPKFATRYGTRISFKNGVWNPASGSYDSDRLKVINVPVLKSHSIYGVTASVKHYMGVVSDKLSGRTAHRSVGTGGMGTQMAQTRFPVLNVLDAIWINAAPGRGPRTRYSQATRAEIIAASQDPVALDYWAAKSILLPAARKLGYADTDSLDPDVTRGGSFGDWLRLSAKALQRAGYPVTLDLNQVSITVTTLEGFQLE